MNDHKIRQSHDRLTFITGIIARNDHKHGLYIDTGLRYLYWLSVHRNIKPVMDGIMILMESWFKLFSLLRENL